MINKGLSIHIIVTLIYCLLVIYVFNGEVYTQLNRFAIVSIGVAINAITAYICVLSGSYDE